MISTQCLNRRCYYCVGLRCEHDCHANVAVVEDLFSTLPEPARTADPDTSHTAAALLKNREAMIRRLADEFRQADLTAEEAAYRAGYGAERGAWKRVSDLITLGLVEDTGLRRKGQRSGRPQRVLRWVR